MVPVMSTSIQIGRHSVGSDHPPFMIAEVSANHNGSLQRAKQIIEAIAKSGAQAAKLQTYRAQDMTLDLDRDEFLISDPAMPWQGQSLYSLYEQAHTPWEWHEELFDYARSFGLEIFSSPFSEEAVDFLERFNPPCYKIASFENNHLPLIRYVASTGRPVIISCGMADKETIQEAVNTANEAGCRDLILLKCTSAYPASPSEVHLHTIPDMQTSFGTLVGLSDHTLGTAVSIAAVARGAVAIEKHVTLSRDDGGPDGSFSLEPDELKRLVEDTRTAWEALGDVRYGGAGNEEAQFHRFRRSIYAIRDMDKGHIITENDVGIIRPGLGLAPKFFDEVVGKKTSKKIPAGTPVIREILS